MIAARPSPVAVPSFDDRDFVDADFSPITPAPGRALPVLRDAPIADVDATYEDSPDPTTVEVYDEGIRRSSQSAGLAQIKREIKRIVPPNVYSDLRFDALPDEYLEAAVSDPEVRAGLVRWLVNDYNERHASDPPPSTDPEFDRWVREYETLANGSVVRTPDGSILRGITGFSRQVLKAAMVMDGWPPQRWETLYVRYQRRLAAERSARRAARGWRLW